MPLYEYQCSKCGKVFEVIQKFSDAPLTVHEECGGHVERLLSAPAFHLKGTGWYVTDYGKGGSKAAEPKKAESSDGAKDSGSGTEKSESKSSETSAPSTETKPESKPTATSTKSD